MMNQCKNRLRGPVAMMTVAAWSMTLAQPVLAGETSGKENLGVVGGAILGALTGGPVGLVIGAGLGGHYGASAHDAARVPDLDTALSAAKKDAQTARHSLVMLQNDMSVRDRQLDALNAELDLAERERAALLALRLDLLYSTGSATLTGQGQRQVAAVAQLLGQMPELAITLDGYADSRGSEAYNEQLAFARAASVREALRAAGIDASRIVLESHGERAAKAAAGDLDGHALDRRVAVGLTRGPARDEPAVVDNR